MKKAIIIQNIAHCPSCEESNYQLTDDYKLVSIEGTKYTEFVARCLNKKCGEKFYFQSFITMSEHKRFAWDRSKETVIKEEKVEYKEED